MEMQEIDENAEMEEDNDDNEDEEESDEEEEEPTQEVFLPGKRVEENEELVFDNSAYVMLHQAHTGAPCLSFDIIRDSLGSAREVFPMTAYIVAGTQAANTHVNSVIVMKMSNLHRTGGVEKDDNEDEDDEELSDDEDVNDAAKKPKMSCSLMRHNGCVNRIRTSWYNNTALAASWSELGRVNIWSLSDQMQAVESSNRNPNYDESHASTTGPLYTFTGHQQEGFAIDWCETSPGWLATGDCLQNIHIWQPAEAGSWQVDQRPLVGHSQSVEDIQWSPNERHVLASCSVDKSIRIWDCRAAPKSACMVKCESAHEADINVISWNKNEPMIASGGDDGVLHIWDLRHFNTNSPVATFKHHTKPIATLEWHPTDSTVLATGGTDDQIALWDLSVEKDDSANEEMTGDLQNLPPQLLFIHQGQSDIKELHWHPQLPGVILSTAHSGFNIFKTISV